MPTTISELTCEPVDTNSEAWRHECECRWLLANKPTKAEKHLHLYGVRDREHLFEFNTKTGQNELAEDWQKRLVEPRPLMKVRNMAAADRILADARKMYEARIARKAE